MALTDLVEMAKASGYFKELPFSGGTITGGPEWYPPSPIAPAPTPEGWVPKQSPFVAPLGSPPLSEFLLEKDPNGKSPNSPGAKLDSGKVRPWLCIAGFSRALEEVARVTTKGAEKYTPNGWAEVPDGIERYMEAFGRHILELGKGNTFDDGPKGLGPDIYHKAQIAWNALASLELELREKENSVA